MTADKLEIMRNLVAQGSKLVILTDFDHTLTKVKTRDGKYACITHEVFPKEAKSGRDTLGELQSLMNSRYEEIANRLEETGQFETLTKLNEEWWTESHKYIADAKFRMRDIETIVRKSTLRLKDEFGMFTTLLRHNSVPAVIFSAGIEQIIEDAIVGCPAKWTIVANRMIENSEGIITGFSEPAIHTSNKTGELLTSRLAVLDYEWDWKDAVIVMIGDSVHDLKMTDSLEAKMVYNIGFCNYMELDKDSKKLDEFERNYDLVLRNESSMQQVIDVVKKVLFAAPAPSEYQVPPPISPEVASILLEEPLPHPSAEMTIAFDALLSQPHVHCKDRMMVERKLRDIVADGVDKLMVISDFDYTLSRAVDEKGERCWTTHGVFDNCADQVAANLSQKFKDLKDIYYPIEFDPHMSIEEKTPHMEKWWSTSHGYIVDAEFNKSVIEKFVAESKVELRNGSERWMRSLNDAAVPLVIFSAGLGDIIDIFLRQRFGKMLDNVHLIANMMKFDEQGIVRDFSEPLIHTFCKNSSVIKKEAGFFHSIAGRSNVILMGDSLGDLHMDVGVEKEGHSLRIGFLNFYTDDLMSKYLDGYDIVVLNDQTMDIPSKITNLVKEVSNKSDGA